MTIYRTLLSKGYFPKELPAAFFTEQFARYATTKRGREQLSKYKPSDNFTFGVDYELALPGGHRRGLALPHPATFARLAGLTAKNFQRLLKKAARSPCTRSRPIFAADRARAIYPQTRPANLARERATVRGGARYLLKIDISQFYPSLYTHAVGWAIDPKLRERKHWGSKKLLGYQLDQALMDGQGKVSQGIPIGNDISFLLAEIVLAQVDRECRLPHNRVCRWFDDYEIACDSLDEAERWLAVLQRAFHEYRLKINTSKTQILELPLNAAETWQSEISEAARRSLGRRADLLAFFDAAFRARGKDPGAAVLSYALGMLYKVACPDARNLSVAQSSITQVMLSEPGSVQKALSVLTFWTLNGMPLDRELLIKTIDRMVVQHAHRGMSSDVAWALSFCLEHNLALGGATAELLARCSDRCIALQTLHMRSVGLLPKRFRSAALGEALETPDLDSADWLLLYEAHRQGFVKATSTAISKNLLFSDLLSEKVSFYRRELPAYASVIHQGGAPDWLVKKWLTDIVSPDKASLVTATPVTRLIAADVLSRKVAGSTDNMIARLVALLDTEGFTEESESKSSGSPYLS